MGRLLSAVEGFCEQAAIRLQSVSAPALASAATAGAAVGPAPVENRALPGATSPEAPKIAEPLPQDFTPKTNTVPKPETSPSPVATLLSAAAASPNKVAPPVMTAAPFQERPPVIWWRSPIVILVGLGTAVILLGILAWPTSSNNQVTSASEKVSTVPVKPVATPELAPAPVPTAKPTPMPAAPAPVTAKATVPPVVAGSTHVELIASEPSWVLLRSGDGATLLSGMIEPGKSQTVDIRQTAVLRAGNAGGLTVRANGKSLGPLGPHGAVREVEFKNGDFKLIPLQ